MSNKRAAYTRVVTDDDAILGPTPEIRDEFNEHIDQKTDDSIVALESVTSSSLRSSASGNTLKYEDEDDGLVMDMDREMEKERTGRVPSSLSRNAILPTTEYQQMEFETTNDFDRSIPLYLRLTAYVKKLLVGVDGSKRSKGDVSIRWVGVTLLILFGAVVGVIGSGGWRNWKRNVRLYQGGICGVNENWGGWANIEYSFVFGDSWSATGFNVLGAQPTPSEPIGNPPFPGTTSSNSTNWIGFLTTKYNASSFLTYDLAVGGTTLDNSIVPSYPGSLTEVMYGRFMPNYASAQKAKWKADNTLFIMFVGINDVMLTSKIRVDTSYDTELDRNLTIQHTKVLDSLYGIGARNFLLMNLPPLERTFMPSYVLKEKIAKKKEDTQRYNRRVEKMGKQLKERHYGDVNIFHFDVNGLLNEVLDDATKFEPTKGLKNTTGYCHEYADGSPTNDYFLPACGIAVNEYFWLNGLHPTYPVHDVIALKVSELLGKGPNVC